MNLSRLIFCHACVCIVALALALGAPVGCSATVTTNDRCAAPIRLLPDASLRISQLAMSVGCSCARMSDGSVRCMGNNLTGCLGVQNLPYASNPIRVPGVSGVIDVAINTFGTVCALTNSGDVWCWGWDGNGLVGNDHAGDDLCAGRVMCAHAPVRLPAIRDAIKIVVGELSVCVIRADRRVMCWGDIEFSSAGAPFRVAHPVEIPGIADAVSLFPSGRSVAIVRSDGSVDSVDSNARVQIPLTASVSGSGPTGRYCYVREDRQAYCWGENEFSVLGTDVGGTPIRMPRLLGVPCVSDISVGFRHSCAIVTDGHVMCWGANESQQVGPVSQNSANCGISRCVTTPFLVSGVDHVVSVSLSDGRTCAIRSDHTVWCWGMVNGESTHTPTRVEW